MKVIFHIQLELFMRHKNMHFSLYIYIITINLQISCIGNFTFIIYFTINFINLILPTIYFILK